MSDLLLKLNVWINQEDLAEQLVDYVYVIILQFPSHLVSSDGTEKEIVHHIVTCSTFLFLKC